MDLILVRKRTVYILTALLWAIAYAEQSSLSLDDSQYP